MAFTTTSTVTKRAPSSASASSISSFVSTSSPSSSWSTTDEPHATRRTQILAKYPQIETWCHETEPLTFVYVVAFFLTQIGMMLLVKDAQWPILVLSAYVVGGTINHSLQLASHELSHNLCWRSPMANKCTALFANLVTAFPSAITFQRYHIDHHAYQGVEGVDTDLPTDFEARLFSSPLLKCLWLFFNPLWYSLRPLFIKPKPFILWEGINWLVQMTFNIAVIQWVGLRGFSYLWIGTILGLGLHPAAGHFIAEHYEFFRGFETYSYYGPWNLINFNVGYHNEHHDFPRAPWTRLPLIRATAKEFYADRPCYTSYIAVQLRFIFDAAIGPWSRVKRARPVHLAKYEQSTAGKTANSNSGFFKYLCIAFATLLILSGVYSVAVFSL